MNFRKKDYFFFDERDEIEVIAWQDLEDGDPQKREIPRRFRRKKFLVQVVVIAIAVVSLSFGVHVCVKRFNSTRNEPSKSESEIGVSADNGVDEDNYLNVSNDEENANSNGNDNNDDAGFPGRFADSNDADEDNYINVGNNQAKVNSNSNDNNDDAGFPGRSPDSNDADGSESGDYSSGQAPQFPQQQDTVPQSEMAETNTTVEPGEIVVLYPNESLDPGQFRYSPNGRFKVGLTERGDDLVLMKVEQSSEAVIWSPSMDLNSNWYPANKTRCFMQSDGNLVLRDLETRKSIWTTRTHGNLQAHLVLDNSGRVAIKSGDESRTILWMDGIPRDRYTGQSSEDMTFPIRGAFYYPWYPSTWSVNGHQAHYRTSLGLYSSSDPSVANAHIDAMDYGKIQLSIASWWGPDTNLDRARLTMLMDETVAQNSPLKWTIYHEDERDFDATPEELREDLNYLKKWFAWHQAWAHIDGRPVIFVYNEGDCDVASRWIRASRGEWYVVLKLFSGFEDCLRQPDSWHQYGVGKTDGVVANPGYSFVISPGFWRADTNIPLLKRVNRTQFCQNAKKMNESGEPWQLVVSFNEAGEGTLIEPSPDWMSDSGYGVYLDCLHEAL